MLRGISVSEAICHWVISILIFIARDVTGFVTGDVDCLDRLVCLPRRRRHVLRCETVRTVAIEQTPRSVAVCL
jgi:hypothetical protein